MKSNKGITLVALVVTIVVLLILAGVSINLVLGQNGLISNAKNARNKTLEAEETEGASLNTASNYIKQTVGVSASGITAGDYGKVVTNYNADGKTWEIFYADESNVYLITRENCGSQSLSVAVAENSGYNGTADFDGSEEFKKKYPAVQAGWLYKIYTPSDEEIGKLNYSSSYINMKCTEYLLDSTVWNEKYLDATKADWAIGGPTVELLVKSHNKYYKEENEVKIQENCGYKEALLENIYGDSVYNHKFEYWLAGPSYSYLVRVRDMGYPNGRDDNKDYDTNSGIRPVVCLKSNIQLKLSEDKNSYIIE